MTASADDARKTIDALFVILDGAVIEETAVLQSQVVDQMLALQRSGIRTGLLTTTRDPGRFESVIGKTLRASGADVRLVPHRGRMANIASMAMVLRDTRKQVRVRAAYARGIWGPLVVRLSVLLQPLRYVYDVRGSVADETIVAGGPVVRLKATVYGALEQWCVRKAWRVTTVSRPLANELRRHYGRDDAVVIPSCIDIADSSVVDAGTGSIRDQLGFARGDLILVYSGGVDRYQAIPRMLVFWQTLAACDNVRFLILTKSDDTSLDAMLAGVPALVGTVVRKSVSRDDVGRYLAACDVGFVFREPRLMNRVASPVKFAEYVAAGLAVVASPEIGDMSSFIVDRHIGIVVDVDDLASSSIAVKNFLTRLRVSRDEVRRRARELARERYTWSTYTSVYRDLYEMSDAPGPD